MSLMERIFSKNHESSPVPPGTSPGGIPARSLEIIEGCCASRVPAVVTWPETSVSRWAFFNHVVGDLVVFEHVPARAHSASRIASACSVSFVFRSSLSVFASTERFLTEPLIGSGLGFAVEIPTDILVEGRSLYRIPVSDAIGLQIRCRYDGVTCANASVVDLHTQGARISFSADDDPLLDIDDVVELELCFEGRVVRTVGRIRRCTRSLEESHFGILFQDDQGNPCDRPPAALTELASAVERAWLSRRVR